MAKKILRFLSGESFTVVLLLLLMVVTVAGTLAQTSMGLFQAKKLYFDSWFCPFTVGVWFGVHFSLFLPGGYLLCALLFVNMVLAALFRFSWNWKNAGLLMCHFGVLLFFVGSYLTFHYAREGYLSLAEGQSAREFVSYHFHELAVIDTTHAEHDQFVVFPEKVVRGQGSYKRASLPFTVAFEAFYENCRTMAGAPPNPGIFKQNFVLRPMRPAAEDERNRAGCVVNLSTGDKPLGEVSLWLEQPVSFMWDNRHFTLLLRKQRTDMPFAMRLLQFTHETYPGTDTPKRFESRVELNENNNLREVAISMNRPLRYKGFTFYQSSFSGDRPGNYQSVLAVVNNPSAAGPYLACLLVLLGMIVHFTQKLLRFLRQRSGKE